MSKKCSYCGAELPDEASFCPHCANSLIERIQVKPPRIWKKKALISLIILLVLAVMALTAYLIFHPKTYEGGATVTYTDGDGTYELMVCFYPGDISNNRPVRNKTVSLSADEMSEDTPMLGIYQDGKIADTDAFFEKVESCTMEAVPNENGALVYDVPIYSTDFAPAARVCEITYTGNSGTNDLIWTIRMKNGDVIRLNQTYEVIPLEHCVYTAEDTPLDTLEDLKALVERVKEEVPEDAIVDIYLPAVTYEGNLCIVSRAANLYGCTDGSGRTVFTGTLAVNSDSPHNVMLFDLDFVGSGGTGLSATASVYMGNCTFTGWDIGAVALDGGMIGVENCEFRKNGVGFRYDTAVFTSFNDVFPDCIFEGNDVGVQFENLGGTITIDFAGSTFSGNRIDIDNPIDYPVETAGAIFN